MIKLFSTALPLTYFIFAFTLLAANDARATDAVECWPRHAEEPLTLPRIMRQFRDNLNDADWPLSAGLGDPLAVSDAELDASAGFVGVALKCTDVVLEDTAEAYIPSRARELEGEARAKYLEKYYGYMREFRAAMSTYRDMLVELRAKPPGDRDFRPVYFHASSVREVANQAHHHL